MYTTRRAVFLHEASARRRGRHIWLGCRKPLGAVDAPHKKRRSLARETPQPRENESLPPNINRSAAQEGPAQHGRFYTPVPNGSAMHPGFEHRPGHPPRSNLFFFVCCFCKKTRHLLGGSWRSDSERSGRFAGRRAGSRERRVQLRESRRSSQDERPDHEAHIVAAGRRVRGVRRGVHLHHPLQQGGVLHLRVQVPEPRYAGPDAGHAVSHQSGLPLRGGGGVPDIQVRSEKGEAQASERGSRPSYLLVADQNTHARILSLSLILSLFPLARSSSR